MFPGRRDKGHLVVNEQYLLRHYPGLLQQMFINPRLRFPAANLIGQNKIGEVR
jgi:hypothetical protein